jgi:Holliday junction DNA helicase RuvA
MIAALHGIIETKGVDWCLIRIGGIGFQVHMPPSSLARLSIGEEVHLHTHLQIREDGLALYGFTSLEELGLFQSLLSVSGIGPRVALSLLSALTPEQLVLAITSGDVDLLSQVSGVGKKTASRLVLELKGKLEKMGIPLPPTAEEDAEVISALTNLGYTLAQATKAVSSLPAGKQLSLEDKIKLALQNLGAK